MSVTNEEVAAFGGTHRPVVLLTDKRDPSFLKSEMHGSSLGWNSTF
jgi:hypothetical protein